MQRRLERFTCHGRWLFFLFLARLSVFDLPPYFDVHFVTQAERTAVLAAGRGINIEIHGRYSSLSARSLFISWTVRGCG